MVEFIGIGTAVGVGVTIAGWIAYQIRSAGKAYRFIKNLQAQDPYYVSPRWADIDFQWGKAGEYVPEWKKAILFIGHKRIAIYPYPPKEDSQPIVSIDPQELRGFWRPKAYHDERNEVWIHAESVEHWGILKLRTWKSVMQDIIRALKEVHSPEQVKAYRRSRPYPHLGPSPVLPAKQSLTGEWELFNAVELYLMPLHLVIMKEGILQRVLHIEAVQNIAALKRMEGGEPVGIVRFVHDEENFAFATNEYEAWASSIAEAAKRSLEEPMMQKQKSKEGDWDDVDINME
jgi:hypothetical protein